MFALLICSKQLDCSELQGRGYILPGEDYAQRGTATGRRISSVLCDSRGSMMMPQLRLNDKHGEYYNIWSTNRCRVTFSQLPLVEGLLPAHPISTKIQHGYFTQMGIHRTYHIVGDLCRLSIATHGTDSASISRNQKAISVMAVYARIRAYVLAESDLVTNHVRIVGTRNERGFRNLLPGDPWQFGDGGVRYASVESDLRARIDVARSLLTKLYKVIDAVSIRAAPEMAEENLPPLRIVFSSCRSRGGAFSGTGVRRQDLPAGTGVYKPAAYWNALHSSREEYYDIDKCQSIGNREGKNLSARAGDAVKRIGCPILIAIPIGGQLRYYHLFSDFVDYLCYYDLRIWQEEAGAPNELAYPAPIQA